MRWCGYIFISLILLVSCTKVQTESEGAVIFSLDTKAVQSAVVGTTYRVMMYSQNDRGYRQSGTYYLKQGVADLIACEITETGVVENPEMGINGVSDKVYLVLASPGISCNDDGSFDFIPDAAGNFYLNEPELKTMGGYGSVRFTKPLYDPRSTIAFEFYKKPGVDNFTVVDSRIKVIGVQDVNEKVRIYPALRQVKMASNKQEREMSLTYDQSHTVNPSANNYELFYSTSTPLYVASGIYASQQEAASRLGVVVSSNVLHGEYIYMACNIIQAGRNVEIRMPLNDQILELMPQHNYVYRILVESDYVGVELDVYDGSTNDWQIGGDSSSNIGTLSKTIQVGRWTINGWQSANDGGIDFTIG